MDLLGKVCEGSVVLREEVDVAKCARTMCDNEEQGCVHRDTKLKYCAQCARKINSYAGCEIVVFPSLYQPKLDQNGTWMPPSEDDFNKFPFLMKRRRSLLAKGISPRWPSDYEDLIEQPRYKHDCNHCTFLGQYKEFDLYHCLQGVGKIPTVIARRSDDGPDYSSGIGFGDAIPELAEALRRASARGLKVSISAMSEDEFLKKYREKANKLDDRADGWWGLTADRLFWVLSYDADPDELLEMSRDFLAMSPKDDHSFGSSLDLAKRTVAAVRDQQAV